MPGFLFFLVQCCFLFNVHLKLQSKHQLPKNNNRVVADPERVNELSDAEKSEYQAMVMQNGKLLYSQNCGKCHSFYEPGSRSAAEWTKVMESMAKKAQLDETGKMHVLTYLHYGAKK